VTKKISSHSFSVARFQKRGSWVKIKSEFKTAAISTDIDIPEGQAVVIGKAGTDGLLVAAAKVSE
jgi:hypothetical protein